MNPYAQIAMVDLETLATHGAPAIVAAGLILCVWTGEKLEEIGSYYAVVRPEDWTRQGLTCDGETLAWWLRQSAEARNALLSGPQETLNGLLIQLSDLTKPGFYAPAPDGKQRQHPQLWARGSDWEWLANVWRVVFRMEPPWSYWLVRDLRTLEDIAGLPKPAHTAHIAIDDARAQARHMERCLLKLGAR